MPHLFQRQAVGRIFPLNIPAALSRNDEAVKVGQEPKHRLAPDSVRRSFRGPHSPHEGLGSWLLPVEPPGQTLPASRRIAAQSCMYRYPIVMPRGMHLDGIFICCRFGKLSISLRPYPSRISQLPCCCSRDAERAMSMSTEQQDEEEGHPSPT